MCKQKQKYKALDNYELNRAERNSILEALEIKHNAFINALDNFKGKGDQNIHKEDLRKFPIGEWQILQESPLVRFKQRPPIGDILRFDTEMAKGGEFGGHFHSDCEEYTEVVEGELSDLKTNETFKSGDIAYYDKGVEHIPVAIKDTILRVFFI